MLVSGVGNSCDNYANYQRIPTTSTCVAAATYLDLDGDIILSESEGDTFICDTAQPYGCFWLNGWLDDYLQFNAYYSCDPDGTNDPGTIEHSEQLCMYVGIFLQLYMLIGYKTWMQHSFCCCCCCCCIGLLFAYPRFDAPHMPQQIILFVYSIEPVVGCQDSTACNYNALATDASECTYASGCETCSGETDGTGTLVDNDADDDGVCDADEGTTSLCIIRCNMHYHRARTETCLYIHTYIYSSISNLLIIHIPVAGCTTSSACNYNAAATDDDGSCVITDGVCETCSGETDGTGTLVDNDADDDGVCDADEGTTSLCIIRLLSIFQLQDAQPHTWEQTKHISSQLNPYVDICMMLYCIADSCISDHVDSKSVDVCSEL